MGLFDRWNWKKVGIMRVSPETIELMANENKRTRTVEEYEAALAELREYHRLVLQTLEIWERKIRALEGNAGYSAKNNTGYLDPKQLKMQLDAYASLIELISNTERELSGSVKNMHRSVDTLAEKYNVRGDDNTLNQLDNIWRQVNRGLE